ncbi:NADPH:quinone oxidoreductase family protein [Ketobacter sp. MCCC 1A13808]|uniref:NADPH:quinone oxidoreductase family protein n=1 Tax=Ketobacter sp. MCCC 1A13808 TaxID=2602738 RepID=UPI0012EBD101|nr:NADPH:quinone oxidoreductase family protein [Ketobacter sp. MCCC 1A13808]MVF11115.1 NADPH:quinone oxidoreductase family protein [Ketobacter sp. MCCC 1A13808]
MKAVHCKEFGPPEKLVVEDVPAPTPGANDVLIDVKAAGINFPDTLIIENKYQFKPPLPFIPGTEVSGTVAAVGDQVKHVKPGDQVMGFAFVGGYAEQLSVPAASCFPMPETFSYEQAAAFTMIYGTSYYALKQRGNLQSGETLLVLGASGGVGMAAVELGKLMGATVIAAGGNLEKLAVCKERGADHVVNYNDADWKDQVKALTSGNGADVIYDAVGGDYTKTALRCINWGGRLLVVGFASGDIPQLAANLTLLKSSSIVGVFWGASLTKEAQANQDNFKQLYQWSMEGKIQPYVCASYPLDQVADAMNLLLQRKAIGKVVLTTGETQ